MKSNFFRNQSGQTGFLIILLLAAILIVSASVLYGVSQNTQRTAEETEGSRLLNLAEGGSDLIINQAAGTDIGFNFTEQSLDAGYKYDTDEGVVFPLPQGYTLELNPSKNSECQKNSCIVKIWWHNATSQTGGGTGSVTCDQQAALLVSEYSLDSGDDNQIGNACQNIPTGCANDPACVEFYASCQSFDNNEGTIDPRTGLSRERARYYLFRPAACAGDSAREWDGYETAFGNRDLTGGCGTMDAASLCTTRRMLGLTGSSESDADKNCVNANGVPATCVVNGLIAPNQEKTRLELRANEELSKQFANYYEIPVWPNTTIVRIKALYADTEVLVDMRGQVEQGISTVTDQTNAVRSIEVRRTLPSVPSVFDYALFAGGGDIEKKTTAVTSRD